MRRIAEKATTGAELGQVVAGQVETGGT
jgi:hypothetical protein